jgi:hypothetical protein
MARLLRVKPGQRLRNSRSKTIAACLHSGRTPLREALSAWNQSDSVEAAQVSIPAASTISLRKRDPAPQRFFVVTAPSFSPCGARIFPALPRFSCSRAVAEARWPPPTPRCEASRSVRSGGGRDGRVHYGEGGGIVWDSDPQADLEELLVKPGPFFRMLGRDAPRLTS